MRRRVACVRSVVAEVKLQLRGASELAPNSDHVTRDLKPGAISGSTCIDRELRLTSLVSSEIRGSESINFLAHYCRGVQVKVTEQRNKQRGALAPLPWRLPLSLAHTLVAVVLWPCYTQPSHSDEKNELIPSPSSCLRRLVEPVTLFLAQCIQTLKYGPYSGPW